MATYAHTIGSARAGRTPAAIIYLDVEPREYGPGTHRFGVAAARYRGYRPAVDVRVDSQIFTSPTGFWQWVESHLSPRRTTWLVSHQLGYDLTLLGLWDQLRGGAWKLKSYCIDDPPVVLRIDTPRGRLVCVDLLNYLRLPIWEIAVECGMECQSQEDRRQLTHGSGELAALDCETTQRCIERLMTWLCQHARGVWGTTAAQIAWRAWRAGWCTEPVHVHDDQRALALERAAYVGGRLACWRVGPVQNEITCLDCNSLYGWVMTEHSLPVELLYCRHVELSELKYLLEGPNVIIAEVGIRTDSHDYPTPWIRAGSYSRGKFHSVLAGAECRAAASRGHLTNAGLVGVYRRGIPFAGFVSDLYDSRLRSRVAGDRLGAGLAKALICGLAGKWGQRQFRWQDSPGVTAACQYGCWWDHAEAGAKWIRHRAVAGAVQVEQDGGEWVHSSPAIAAAITAAGRVRMDFFRETAGENECYYEDTDSLHVSSRGAAALAAAGTISPSAIGRLRETDRGNSGHYFGPKDYVVGNRTVRAGAAPTGAEVADGTWRQAEGERLGSLLSAPPGDSVRIVTRDLHRSSRWAEGRVDADGRVRPWWIGVRNER